MTPAARYAAAIDVLDGFLQGEPAEKVLSNWARKNRYAGSKDRAAVRDIVFDCLRNLSSFQATSGLHNGRGLAMGHCVDIGLEPTEVFTGEGYAPEKLDDQELESLRKAQGPNDVQKANLPDWIYQIVKQDFGDGAESVASALSLRAPVDLRVNIAKTSLADAQATLRKDNIVSRPVESVPIALRVIENPRRVAGSKAFSDGFVELQDAASQAVVEILDIQPNARVLDFCAGGGGKTLAMAAKAPAAVFDAWDISAARLEPLKERAKRAGAKVSILKDKPESPNYDLVFIDAPCSGSGSWRRNPEGKWRLTSDHLSELQAIQADILQRAAACMKNGGTLVYATCSIFTCENRAQIDAFLGENPDYTLRTDHSFKVSEPGDGFYCAVLQNNSGV